MKKLLALFVVFVLCGTFLVGCNTNSKGSAKSAGWDYIQKNGKLVVGLDDTFAPMGFRDENNQLVGFDIDLATEVTKLLGVQVEFKPIDWDAKELELSSKKIDCIWNGMSATPERQESMALSKKYLNNRIVVMTQKSDVKISSVDDMKKYNIGTQADSAALETMQGNAAYDTFKSKIKEYKTYDEAILDMQAGRIDCIVVDEVLGEYKSTKMTTKMTVCDFNFGDDFYAIGCRKGETDLTDKINKAIQALIDNGTAKEISEKWFGTNIVILKDYQ